MFSCPVKTCESRATKANSQFVKAELEDAEHVTGRWSRFFLFIPGDMIDSGRRESFREGGTKVA